LRAEGWREGKWIHGEGCGVDGNGWKRSLLCSWTESWDVFPNGVVPVWRKAWREGKEVLGEGCGVVENGCKRSLLCCWTESWDVFPIGSSLSSEGHGVMEMGYI